MALPPVLENLRLPVIGAPMFIAGNPQLVIEQCKAGIVGSFPALNARPKEALDAWLSQIEAALEAERKARPQAPPAPYAVNQIVHRSNDRLEHDLEVCIRHQVPITITSLRAPNDVIPKIHAYGGIVLHDVISVRHAEKALEDGVDGLILVCAGAGGHAGTLSPFALVGEVRRFYDGPIVTHLSSADIYDPELRRIALDVIRRYGIPVHERGTMVVIQGPRFSSKAESHWFSSAGWDVVGMTQFPEAYLCRELGMAVVNIALVTDYDAGVIEGTEAVDASSVLDVFRQNAERIQAVVLEMIERFPADLAALGAADALRVTRGDGQAMAPEDVRLFETEL